MLGKIRAHLRALRRTALLLGAIPFTLGAAVVQGTVAGPVFKNYTAIPNMVAKLARKILGLKVVFNENSLPVNKDQSTWFVANHMSIFDPFIVADKLNGMFAGKGDFMKWPVVSHALRTVRYAGLRREAKYNPESRAKIIRNFNDGNNMVMFPEGTTTDGSEVKMFHAGLITLLFGEKGVDEKGREVALEKDVVVQPVALRVLAVDGKDALHDADVREAYTQVRERNYLKRTWNLLKSKEITLEITALPVLNPADYPDARALINHAAVEVASVVNPGQKVFEKARIPGQRHFNPASVTP